MIAVIDYGMGNLRSVQKALEFVGAKVIVTHDPDLILNADSVVLPGVGAFKDCMANLEELKLWSSKNEISEVIFFENNKINRSKI